MSTTMTQFLLQLQEMVTASTTAMWQMGLQRKVGALENPSTCEFFLIGNEDPWKILKVFI